MSTHTHTQIHPPHIIIIFHLKLTSQKKFFCLSKFIQMTHTYTHTGTHLLWLHHHCHYHIFFWPFVIVWWLKTKHESILLFWLINFYLIKFDLQTQSIFFLLSKMATMTTPQWVMITCSSVEQASTI